MLAATREEQMAKKKAVPPPRVTLINLKGTRAEKDFLDRLSRITGVPISEIARRGMARWAVEDGRLAPPEDWLPPS
jgi:hypothetical protein